MDEGVIGQGWNTRQHQGAWTGNALDGYRTQPCDAFRRVLMCFKRCPALQRAPHVHQQSDVAVIIVARQQAFGSGKHCFLAFRQRQDFRARRDKRVEQRNIPAMQRDRLDLGQRPAQAGGGEREGGGRRYDLQLFPQAGGQQCAYSIVHGIAGGEDDDPLVAPALDAVDHGVEGRRPIVKDGIQRREKAQQPSRTDDDFGL